MPTVSYKTLAQAALLFLYLLSCHFAITQNEPRLQLLAILFLGCGIIFRGLLESSAMSWGILIALIIVAVAFSTQGLLRYVLYLPPIALPLLLWVVFFRSLLPGNVPLITAIAREVRGGLSEELCDYTRGVTLMWCACFMLLAIGSALLSIAATPFTWSLFTNFLNYLIIALLFVVEFLYRQWRFRDIEHKDFWQYLQSIVRVDVRKFR